MVMFDDIEEIFQKIREFNEYAKALVTFASAIGTLVILLYFVKFTYDLYKGLRLYVCSQICCRPKFRQRYGEWAVISGSTDGIGLSMARELARAGMSIIVIGRNEEKLSNTKLSLEEEPNVGQVITVKIDLSDSSIENFESIRDKIDPDNRDIGILINNAGFFESKFARFYNFELDSLRQIVNINVLASLYLTRMILPGMVKRQKGLVLNVSSTLGAIPAPYMSVYGATKTFLDSFSRQLQIEYASHPVDIINLTPGAVHTKLFTNTATIPKPSPVNPSPDDYARSALNAVGTRYPSISGTWFHGLGYKMGTFFDSLGLVPILLRINLKLNARNAQLSPVMSRKRKPVSTNDVN